ncbi:MAG TPA: hypothetical protein VMV89_04495 [Candidatus Paceibacterota bacterium]|nr:hypothetical protein [Candidatus Paceibacterota bacterium]
MDFPFVATLHPAGLIFKLFVSAAKQCTMTFILARKNCAALEPQGNNCTTHSFDCQGNDVFRVGIFIAYQLLKRQTAHAVFGVLSGSKNK